MQPTNDDENVELSCMYNLLSYNATITLWTNLEFRFSIEKNRATRDPFILDSKYLIGVSMKFENLFRFVFLHTYNRFYHYSCVDENKWMESPAPAWSNSVESTFTSREKNTHTHATSLRREKKITWTQIILNEAHKQNLLFLKSTQNKNCYRFIDFAMKSFNIIVVFLFPAKKIQNVIVAL